jgi:hypothetical protein
MPSPKPAMIGAARAFEGRGDACAQPILRTGDIINVLLFPDSPVRDT